MVDRWLQWIVAGVVTLLAVFWIGSAIVTAPAMETPRLTAAPQAEVNSAPLTETEPLAFVEPPPLTQFADGQSPFFEPPSEARNEDAGPAALHAVQQPRNHSSRRSASRHVAVHRKQRRICCTPPTVDKAGN